MIESHETEDNWLADLTVVGQSGYIKIGSITQSERLAKYKGLLAIEAATKLELFATGSSTHQQLELSIKKPHLTKSVFDKISQLAYSYSRFGHLQN